MQFIVITRLFNFFGGGWDFTFYKEYSQRIVSFFDRMDIPVELWFLERRV